MLPKKKRHIAFLLGCLWHYIKKLEVKEFPDGCDIMAEIAVLLGINWNLIQEACRKYEEVIEFEEDTWMDIEKLIERLRNNNTENNCHDCALGYYAFEAATALSTLQDENEKLRAELERVKRCIEIVEHQRDEAIYDMTALMAGQCCDMCSEEN